MIGDSVKRQVTNKEALFFLLAGSLVVATAHPTQRSSRIHMPIVMETHSFYKMTNDIPLRGY